MTSDDSRNRWAKRGDVEMRRVIAAACAVLLLGAGPAAGRPFVAKDLAMLDRVAQSSPIKLTQDEKAPPSARWSASGRLYFLSGKSGSQQLWRREKDGTLVQ